MRVVLAPGPRSGLVKVPASKSQAHRLLILAALSGCSTDIICDGISKDIEATAACLRGLGTEFTFTDDGKILVRPGTAERNVCKDLFCGESGSTLRFLLPVVGALAQKGVFHREGRLSERPLSPLMEELEAHGMSFRSEGELLYCEGALTPGKYSLPGNISSQYISGLLMALPLLSEDSVLEVTGKIESGGYITMTEDALRLAGVVWKKEGWTYYIPGKQQYRFPEETEVEKDWSGAAFSLCMGAFTEKGVEVRGLNPLSSQGDHKILDVLERFGACVNIDGTTVTVKKGSLKGCTVDAAEIPDLVPVISSVAALSEGQTTIIHAERLRIKESDRLMTVASMLTALGGDVSETEDGLIINGKPSLSGGQTETYNDHRIAMAAAVAAAGCTGEVSILGAECVQKSFPTFWEGVGDMEEEA